MSKLSERWYAQQSEIEELENKYDPLRSMHADDVFRAISMCSDGIMKSSAVADVRIERLPDGSVLLNPAAAKATAHDLAWLRRVYRDDPSCDE